MALSGEKISRLTAMYNAAFTAVKTWIESRYKMFQFAAILNVGALTLGFDKGLLKPGDDPIAGIFLVAVNLLVAIIGLRTEFSNRVYNVSYFKTLNEIERKINGENENEQEKPLLEDGGPFKQGGPAQWRLHGCVEY